MTNILLAPATPATQAFGASAAKARPGIFARLLSALHDSRRRDAHRLLRQYRHLIDRRDQCHIR